MRPDTSEDSRSRRRSRTGTHQPANESDDDQGPARKRTRLRVTTACEECRRRKERCDGDKPTCQRCKNVGRTCSYHQGRKRGLKTGYVRGLEILLGLFLHECPEAEDIALSVLHGSDHGHSGETRPRPNRQNKTAQPLSLLECWRKSPVLEELQRVLAASETEEDEESFLDGLNSRLTESLHGLSPMDHDDDEPDIRDERDEMSTQDTTITVQLPTPVSTSFMQPIVDTNLLSSEQGIPHCSLPSNSTRLLDIYTDQVHTFLPIIPKHALLRSHSILRDSKHAIGSDDLPSLSPGDTASLWAAMAYGAYVLEAVNPAKDHMLSAIQVGQDASQLLSTAISLAKKDEETFESSHVHSFLILALLRIAQGSWTKAWLWLGKAIYVGASIKLFPRQSHTPVNNMSESSKRLFLGCFFFDSLLSAALGHRPYFQREDLDAAGLVSTDGLEEWETWHPLWRAKPSSSGFDGSSRSLSTFNDLVFLAGIINAAGQPPTHPSSKELAHSLLEKLLQKQAHMLCPIRGMCTSEHLLTYPPHVNHLTVATAISYLVMRVRVSSKERRDLTISPALNGTLKMLAQTSTMSSHFRLPHLPPTAGLFFRLLELHGLSSATCPLRSDWTDFSLSSDPFNEVVEYYRMPRQNQSSRSYRVPPTSITSARPIAESTHDLDTEASHSVSENTMSESVAAPHQHDLRLASQPTADDGAGSIATADSALSDNAGLFGQLSLLDEANWYVQSVHDNFQTEFLRLTTSFLGRACRRTSWNILVSLEMGPQSILRASWLHESAL